MGGSSRDATGVTGPVQETLPSDLVNPGEPAAPAVEAEPGSAQPLSISLLLDRARNAQAQLSAQPLPIANRDLLLIQKLFGG